MDDDFNTPQAMAVLIDLRGELNRARLEDDRARANRLAGELRNLAGELGLLQTAPEDYFKEPMGTLRETGAEPGASPDRIDELVRRRDSARAAKNWAEADRLRKELDAMGIILEDGPRGTTWRRK
jgi:cysteinyl-tRNA synthetase